MTARRDAVNIQLSHPRNQRAQMRSYDDSAQAEVYRHVCLMC